MTSLPFASSWPVFSAPRPRHSSSESALSSSCIAPIVVAFLAEPVVALVIDAVFHFSVRDRLAEEIARVDGDLHRLALGALAFARR